MKHGLCVILVVGTLLPGCDTRNTRAGSAGSTRLRLAVTTSTQDSGILDALVPLFETEHAVRVDVIPVGTGAALKLGSRGDVDVVLVHSRQAEDAFLAAGHAVRREDVMFNTFELLGPPADPAGIRGRDPVASLRAVAQHKDRFISRGDDSGTHQHEQNLWTAGGGRPDWPGYIEAGQGMGATLIMADQMSAYVLTDRGTYLRFRDKIDLVPLTAASPNMRNPYGILTVNPDLHPGVNHDLADRFVDFLIAPEAQRIIRDFRVAGEPLFYPLRLSETD